MLSAELVEGLRSGEGVRKLECGGGGGGGVGTNSHIRDSAATVVRLWADRLVSI